MKTCGEGLLSCLCVRLLVPVALRLDTTGKHVKLSLYFLRNTMTNSSEGLTEAFCRLTLYTQKLIRLLRQINLISINNTLKLKQL